MKENEKKELELAEREKVGAYSQICDEVERNSMTIDSEVSAFKNKSFTF